MNSDRQKLLRGTITWMIINSVLITIIAYLTHWPTVCWILGVLGGMIVALLPAIADSESETPAH